MSLKRFVVCCLLCCGLVSGVAAQAPAAQPNYPQPGYQPYQQPQPQYPQQPYPQGQPPQAQPGPYYQPYPQQGPNPNYGYPPGYQPGYPPQAAQAPEPLVSSVEGALQLGFSASFVQYFSGSQKFDLPGDIKNSLTDLTWGFARNPLSLEAAYGLTPNLLIGGVLQLGGDSQSAQITSLPKAENGNFNLLIGPKVDYMFMPTSKLNPFAGAQIALQINPVNDGGGVKESRTLFNFMARGGVRYFVFDNLSIDPTLALGFALGSGTRKTDTPASVVQTAMGPVTVPGATVSNDFSMSAFQFALSIGLSLWLK